MIRYLKIHNNSLSIEICDKASFDDIIIEEVGCSFGQRLSTDGKFIIIEDNCLEGDETSLNKTIFNNGLLYGTCFIIRSDYNSLNDEDLRYLYNEIQIDK